MTLKNLPVSRVQMLIRRPAGEVFQAFVDPSITRQFWFTNSSGALKEGKTVRWDWEMYGASAEVTVKTIEVNRAIRVQWGDPPRTVEWEFAPRSEDSTLVTIVESGFSGTDDEAVDLAIDSKGGFTIVLAGLKALLEHGISLNLVADQHPDNHITTGST